MSGALTGRTALVTGASSGIGLATALALHDLGATVHAAARRRAAIAEAAGEREGLHAHALDVTDPAAAQALADGPLAEAGLDVLVLAAGTNVPERRLGELTPESWDAIVATNLSGVFHLVRACLPALRAARGLVVVVASVSASWPDASGPAYQAAKAGALAFTRAARLEERERGVRFSAVLPGLVDTPFMAHRTHPPDRETLARALRASDVADACAFLATLPARAYVPELTLLPTELQALGAS